VIVQTLLELRYLLAPIFGPEIEPVTALETYDESSVSTGEATCRCTIASTAAFPACC